MKLKHQYNNILIWFTIVAVGTWVWRREPSRLKDNMLVVANKMLQDIPIAGHLREIIGNSVASVSYWGAENIDSNLVIESLLLEKYELIISIPILKSTRRPYQMDKLKQLTYNIVEIKEIILKGDGMYSIKYGPTQLDGILPAEVLNTKNSGELIYLLCKPCLSSKNSPVENISTYWKHKTMIYAIP